jgi:hypothetical protein
MVNRTVMAGNILMFFYFAAFYLSLQPYFMSYLLATRKMSGETAGYIMNTFSMSCTVTVFAVGYGTKYFKCWKPFLWIGLVLYTLGVGLMLMFRNVRAPIYAIVITQSLVGVGGGFINGPNQLGVQAACAHADVATATSMFLTVMSLGGAVGGSISGAVWTSGVKGGMMKYLPDDMKSDVDTLFGDVTKVAALEAGSPGKLAVDRAYDETMFKLVLIAVCMCAPMYLAALFMKPVPLDQQRLDGAVVFGNMEGRSESPATTTTADSLIEQKGDGGKEDGSKDTK